MAYPRNDIATWVITIPKWLVAEFNTHKVEIERNSASSRAVPTSLIIDMVNEHPCFPIWKYNQSGMSAVDDLSDEDEAYADKVWLEIRDAAIEGVRKLQKLPSGRSVAKGTANRPLEFIMWTQVVVTMTGGGGIGINNFFGLRDTVFAQPEFQLVASMMHKQYHESKPVRRLWHLPFNDDPKYNELGKQLATPSVDMVEQAVISSAHCGRVTHYRQDKQYSKEEDMNRGMAFARDGHYSPLRHAAVASDNTWYGNMFGWQPISKVLMEKDYVQKCCEKAK